jgi:plastocyanin domain-containing protein
VPLLFGIGALSSFLSEKFTSTLFKVSGLLVITLGFIMLGRGLSLAGVVTPKAAFQKSAQDGVAVVSMGRQDLVSELKLSEYPAITVQKGLPLRWVIHAEASNLNNCNQVIVIPDLGIEKKLVPGDNVIEFTPVKSGTMAYSCWMGMISGTIEVVDGIAKAKTPAVAGNNPASGAAAPICCGVASPEGRFSGGQIPMDALGVGEIRDGLQTVRVRVNDGGFEPTVLVLQKGIRTRWEFMGEKLNNCNFRIIIPDFGAKLQLRPGLNAVELTPEKGFGFSCWMGMLNGYVAVVDDVCSFDYNQIRRDVAAYMAAVPVRGCSGCGGTGK